ncbi:MAG: hypothetical protein JXB30_14925 [Anaerolineae bacterium]|nr:hypothetical protein [Anaerolineae bacterium]
MSAWQEILNAALIGTNRKPFTPPAADGIVGDMLAQIEGLDGEHNLLAAAAALTQWQRAGVLPPSDASSFAEPSQPDDRPRCSARAGQHLLRMLNGDYVQALPEWLDTLYQSGQRVAEEYLPAVLTRGAQSSDLREAIIKVIGERGRWLAALNDQWRYAIGLHDEVDWETAATTARVLFLRDLRTTDPDHARELIEEAWPNERADDRAGYLETLHINLSMADEPFIESCLDDRSKKVRVLVPDLLARLPQSAYIQRMIERVESCITLKGGAKPKLEVILPTTLDEAMLRDGIEEKPPTKMGKKAWWLLQMLRAIPLNYWGEEWRKTPTELVDIADGSDWKEAFHEGWITAAGRHPDPEWVVALLKKYPTHGGILQSLAPEEQERCVLELLEAKAYEDDDGLFRLIAYNQRRWSEDYAGMALKHINQYYKKHKDNPNWYTLQHIQAAAYTFPPELLEDARKVLLQDQDDTSYWRRMADTFIDTLEFRRSMLEELKIGAGG